MGLGARERHGKRVFDLTLACVMAALFAPLMLLIMAMIRLKDGGPAIFAHERVGRGGRRFRCLKFRTMVRDSESVLERLLAGDDGLRREWEQAQKLRDDPRIIPGVGHLLRSTSLDELPQLLNVLRGDMSLVGPRPVVEDELCRYGAFRQHYLSVKPGLTGPWQTSGRSDASYDERVALDVWYVEESCLRLDLVIVLRTALSFICGRLGGAC